MAIYICKCGRQVNKSTNADNTGNRDTDGCTGCPYLLPWGPDKYIEGQGFRKEVQGFECRMSPTISYTTTYNGQANDKCTLHILSLDLDFLDTVQAWIDDNASDTLSAGFSRGSMRGTDFSNKGRYSLSISCVQNKKGMAAKAALIEQFFTGSRVRKDMTLVQEKAHILAAIKRGKENASKMNYIISQHDNGLLYAYHLGTFWFWLADKRWVPSDFAKQEYEKAQKKNPRITPEEFMDSDDFIQMDDYEVPSQKLSALKALTPADSRMHAPDAEDVTDAPAASAEAREIVDECSESDEECPYLQPLENSKKYNCQCSLCGDKFVNRDICNKSFRGCGWYQDQQEKDARHDDEEEIPATDSCQCRTCEHESCFAHGCTKECPANAEESCLTTSCPEYREKPQVTANPTHAARNAQPCVPGASGVQPSPYPNLSDAQGEFEAWIRREQLEPVAQTMDAAAITDELAAKDPFKVGETSTVSPENSLDVSSCPSAEPARQAPAALPLSAPDTAPMSLPAFDYTGLDADTAEKLRGITDRVMELSQTYAWGMAYQVGRAHDLLCGDGACETVSQAHKRNNQHSENTFTAWCAYIGVERRSAYNLLNAYRLICKATPEQQKNLQLAPAKLLYVAGKKDTPDQLANAVLDGDITSHKQYQDLLARYNAEKAAREKAEHEAALDRKEQEDANSAALRYKNECDRRAQDQQRLEGLVNTAKRERDDARRQATEAENRAAGAQKLAEQRGTENTELKAKIRELEDQPRDVAVVQPGEEQIEAWRREGADRMAATMQETVRKANEERLKAQNRVTYLQEQLATARPDADACQRTADTLYETAENLRILLRTQLKQAQLSPTAYGKVVAHVLQVARTLLDTVRVCAPDGYEMDSEEDDDFE